MPAQSQRLTTTVLIGAAFLAGVDLFIVNVAFDEIGRDFADADLTDLSWILNAYAVVYAALLVPMGRLADRAGQKRGFIAGMAVFVAASVACGFAPGIWWLVAFRVLQAVGAAAMTPASLGLLLATAEPSKRASTARLFAMTSAVAAALGPALGGGLVQISWQWAFWINLPIGLLLMVGAFRFVPDVRHNDGAPLPDLPGAALVVLAVGALVFGLVQGSDWGWSSTPALCAFALAVVAGSAFAWRNRRHPEPIVPPALLAVPAFRWANLATLVFNAAFGAGLLGGILWLQLVWEYDALSTGLAIALGPLAVPLAAVLSQRLFPTVRPGHMIATGSLLYAVAAVWQATTLGSTPAYWSDFAPPWVLGGIGVGLAMPNLLAAATTTLPPAQASTGGGIVTMSRQVGLVLGVSMLVTVVDGTEAASGLAHAWYAVAGCMVLTAAIAVGMARAERSRPPSTRSDAPTLATQ